MTKKKYTHRLFLGHLEALQKEMGHERDDPNTLVAALKLLDSVMALVVKEIRVEIATRGAK